MTRVCGKHLSYSDTEKTDWEHFDSLTCDGLIAADGNVVAAPVLKYNLPSSGLCHLPPVCHLPHVCHLPPVCLLPHVCHLPHVCVIYPLCVITS